MPYIFALALFLAPTCSFAHSSKGEEACLRILSGEGFRANQPSSSQRQMAMGLELLKIKTPDAGNVRTMIVNEEIRELSRANLNRFIEEIPRPPTIKVTPEQQARIEEMAASLTFISVARYQPDMIGPIGPTDDLYSRLVGGSKTVGLRVIATPKPNELQSLQGLLYGDSIRADAEFVRRYGVVVPDFSNVIQLLNFFAKWQPESLEQVVKINRYNLPTNVRTVSQFRQYLNPSRMSEILPDHALPTRLAPLKENFHLYLLTVPDAEIFYRHMLIVYMQLAIEVGLRSMMDYERAWSLPGWAGYLFQEAMQAAGWPEGASVRVPLNLPHYGIIRYDEVRPPDPRANFRRDTRRLDHKHMP